MRFTRNVRRKLGTKGSILITVVGVVLVAAAAGLWIVHSTSASAVGCTANESADECAAQPGQQPGGQNSTSEPASSASATASATPGPSVSASVKPSVTKPSNPGTGGNGAGGSTGGGSYPARFTVGAPGVGKYKQSDAKLPVPAGYQELAASDSQSKAYNLYQCGNINIDHKYIHAFIYIGTDCHGTVNITNSIIAPPPGSTNRAILVNANSSGTLKLNISNTTIRPEPVGVGKKSVPLNDHAINDCDGCTIHLNRVDVANTGGMCLCGANTTIEYSWLHDNYIANLTDPSAAHTGGVFPYGGSGPLEISHSRLEPGVDAYSGLEIKNYWQAITAVLFTQSAGGSTLRNYSVHESFISLGAYGLYVQDGEGLKVRNNVFGPSHWGATSCGSGCKVTFSDWTNNVAGAIDGTPLTQAVAKP